jgi:LmbE family N-acetylglucosaminyl deacetylase
MSGAADRVVETLRHGTRCSEAVVVVIAHPDDESLGMGGRLPCFDHLTLVQLTDGAPRSGPAAPKDIKSETYAAQREAEARAALDILGQSSCDRRRCGIPDQEAVYALPKLLADVAAAMQGAAAVFTHPYEGGHPDHDAAALVTQMASDLISVRGAAPPQRFEFASYHRHGGALVTGRFLPDPSCPEIAAQLSPDARQRKAAAIACYVSQAEVTRWFDPGREPYRMAPRYDFDSPPDPEGAHYDNLGWPMTSTAWRRIAKAMTVAIRERLAWPASR